MLNSPSGSAQESQQSTAPPEGTYSQGNNLRLASASEDIRFSDDESPPDESEEGDTAQISDALKAYALVEAQDKGV